MQPAPAATQKKVLQRAPDAAVPVGPRSTPRFQTPPGPPEGGLSPTRGVPFAIPLVTTQALRMTGLGIDATQAATGPLQMTGLGIGALSVPTGALQMTGLGGSLKLPAAKPAD